VRFHDRIEAGRLLAARLADGRGERPVVLAVTGGGVPVAFEVARALGAALEPIVVRKLGAPDSPEFALGAIAEGGAAYLNPEALLEAGLRDADVEAIAEREAAELARRARLYRGGRSLPDLHGRTAIVVDDGVATGATAHAAARAARAAGADRVVLAAPVIAADAVPDLRTDLDDVVAVEYPAHLVAVGVWYERFAQVGDDEVIALLARAGRGFAEAAGTEGGEDPRGADPPAPAPRE
jgi:putative phosphoribosyl transferase